MTAFLEIVLPLLLSLAIVVTSAADNTKLRMRSRQMKHVWGAAAGILALVTVVWAIGSSRTVALWAELQLLWLAPVLFWSAIAMRVGSRNSSRRRASRITRNSVRFLLWFALGIGLSWMTSLILFQFLVLSPRAVSWPFAISVRVGQWVELFLPALTTFHGRMDGWAWNRAILCVVPGFFLWRTYRRSVDVHGEGRVAERRRIPLLALSAFIFVLVGVSAFAPSSCRSWRFGWCEGRLNVPVNAQVAGGATISVSYLIHPSAGDTPPQGTIVAANGGPSAASPFRSQMIDVLGEVADTHDVLISDYRGLGRSHPVDCPGLNMGPATKEVVEQCELRLGLLVNELSARRAADDLEAIRKHLKLGQVDLYGESYGTFFAQTYAHMYPSAVRSMILDSSIPLHTPPDWTFMAGQHTQTLWLHCEDRGECKSDALLVSAWREVIEDARHEQWDTPSVIDLATIDVYGGWPKIRQGRADALLLKGEPRKAALAALSSKLEQQLKAMRSSENSKLIPHEPSAVYACNDYPTPFSWSDPIAAREESTRVLARKLFTNDIAPFTWDEFNQATERSNGLKVDGYRYEGCLYWAYGGATPPVYGDAPSVDVLLISGLMDTSTTPKMAAEIAAVWPRAKLLNVVGGDHFVLADLNADCAREAASKFLADPDGYVPTECSLGDAASK